MPVIYSVDMFSNEKRKVISLFSGAGCFDIGFETSGFKTVFANDLDKDSCDTFRLNRKCAVLQAPIEELTVSTIRSLSGVRSKNLDLLIGGPPCQPYSKSSYGVVGSSHGFYDQRGQTLRHYFRVVEGLLPKCFVIENVPQFITGENIRVKQYMSQTVARINKKYRANYKLHFWKLNAAHFGVPQTRERLFIIAARDGTELEAPMVRHSSSSDSDLQIQPLRTAWDAIGDIRLSIQERKELTVGGRWGGLLETIPAGSNYLWHTERGGGQKIFRWRSRYWNFLLKLHPFLPSWTIAASPGQHTGPFHWDGRRLSLHELQLLQTIPSDYLLAGSMTSIRKQIGNGVPAALGELLGKEIRRQVFGDRVTSDHLKLIPDVRSYSSTIKSKYPALKVPAERVAAAL